MLPLSLIFFAVHDARRPLIRDLRWAVRIFKYSSSDKRDEKVLSFLNFAQENLNKVKVGTKDSRYLEVVDNQLHQLVVLRATQNSTQAMSSVIICC